MFLSTAISLIAPNEIYNHMIFIDENTSLCGFCDSLSSKKEH